MAEQEQEQTYPGYPKHYNMCPNCGSTEREVESMMNELKEEGRIKKDAVGVFERKITGVAIPNPLNIPDFKVPGLIADFDMCSKCGTVYPFTVVRAEIPFPQMQPMPRPGFRPPPAPMPPMPGQGG